MKHYNRINEEIQSETKRQLLSAITDMTDLNTQNLNNVFVELNRDAMNRVSYMNSQIYFSLKYLKMLIVWTSAV